MIGDPSEVEASAMDPEFLAFVLERQRAQAHTMLATAAEVWIAGGCPRFNDQETSCSAVLVGFLLDLIREGRKSGFQIAAFLETGGWTKDHLDGSANPAAVPRPDIALFLGVHHDVKMPIECKRLLRPDASAKDYVLSGLCRFLSGTYEACAGQATMVCFVMDRDVPTACNDVNAVITAQLSSDQILSIAPPLGSFQDVYHSQHIQDGEPLEAVHLLVDIQSRPAARARK